jgi:hypothetical protein
MTSESSSPDSPGPLPFLAVFLLVRFAWWGPGRRGRRTARVARG